MTGDRMDVVSSRSPSIMRTVGSERRSKEATTNRVGLVIDVLKRPLESRGALGFGQRLKRRQPGLLGVVEQEELMGMKLIGEEEFVDEAVQQLLEVARHQRLPRVLLIQSFVSNVGLKPKQ